MGKRKLGVLSLLLITFFLMSSIIGCSNSTTTTPGKSSNAVDSFPNKPVTLVIPFGAGGSHDAHARLMEKVAQKYLGVPLLIELQPGGSGAVGSNYVAKAKPDGYTLLFGSNGADTVVPLVEEVPYSREDFVPVARINYSAQILEADPKVYKTLQDVIDDAKKRPGKISFASSGMFNSGHIAWQLFQDKAGIQLNHVPMDGAEPQLAVLGGQVPLCAAFADEVGDLVKENKLVPLAVTSKERIKAFPDVPTLKELGYDVDFEMWRTVLAPKGTDPAVVAKLEKAFQGICTDPEFIDLVQKMGEDVYYMGSSDFSKFWDDEIVQFKQTFKK